MEFNLGTIIISSVFIGICLIPIVLTKGNKKKREKAFLAALNNIASNHNGKISQFEICGDIAIGIDEDNHFAYFYKNVKEKVEELYADLSQTKCCMINNVSSIAKYKDHNVKVIEKLELKFLPKVKNNNEVKFEFYNDDESMDLNGELQAIQKWTDLINSHIKQMN
ncbi:MAG: hypothetical protein DWP98_03250 [Bacteroidetes bacterium]|nr:MAG: hypothetical protein DWP98_03250 [Bacteroidota bacterium]MBL1145423.1 hypothetical protein [Bacteroidota bacterium]MCB0803486.1 hypothetical protein [Flavobacteriales bacterium]NOG58221.1 hypothetical protein [Bacteroidota bacterium]